MMFGKLSLDGDSWHNATSSSLLSKTRAFNPYSPVHSSIGVTVLSLVSVLFFLVLVTLYICRCIKYSSSNSDSHHFRPPPPPRSPSLPWLPTSNKTIAPSIVGSLPAISYGGDAKHPIICLSKFQEGRPSSSSPAVPTCSIPIVLTRGFCRSCPASSAGPLTCSRRCDCQQEMIVVKVIENDQTV